MGRATVAPVIGPAVLQRSAPRSALAGLVGQWLAQQERGALARLAVDGKVLRGSGPGPTRSTPGARNKPSPRSGRCSIGEHFAQTRTTLWGCVRPDPARRTPRAGPHTTRESAGHRTGYSRPRHTDSRTGLGKPADAQATPPHAQNQMNQPWPPGAPEPDSPLLFRTRPTHCRHNFSMWRHIKPWARAVRLLVGSLPVSVFRLAWLWICCPTNCPGRFPRKRDRSSGPPWCYRVSRWFSSSGSPRAFGWPEPAGCNGRCSGNWIFKSASPSAPLIRSDSTHDRTPRGRRSWWWCWSWHRSWWRASTW